MFACKELGEWRFVVRLAGGGLGVNLEQLLQLMAQTYDSLQFAGGAK
ncbi:MAG: hypothetical protein N3C12_00885 [Candidatus Binatia bacterium]|nr:hypothetical protein [Candidatus Binatia bacterium]